MAAIAIFGGTAEGRRLAERLKRSPLEIYILVATEYGASLLSREENVHVLAGRMDEKEMAAFFSEKKISCCLDATHPYATAVTANIFKACRECGIEYLRIGRATGESRTGADTVYVNSVREAACFLKCTEGNVLITTGSKELAEYCAVENYKERCFARVLPIPQVVQSCAALGFEGRNLIGMQGPFSEEMNRCMIRQFHIRWMVTKQSGAVGGYPEKCEAALQEGIGLIIVGRPEEPVSETISVSGAVSLLQERYGFSACRRKLWLLATGMGGEGTFTVEAVRSLKECDIIIGAGRVLESCRKLVGTKPFFESYRGAEIAAFLDSHPEYENIAAAFSGDIGFYSGAAKMRRYLTDFEVHAVPGIASPVYFLDRLGIPWEDAVFASRHGKECRILPMVRRHKKLVLLLGKETDVSEIAKQLLEAGLSQVRMTVGERLSYPEEYFTAGMPEEFAGRSFDPLAVLLLQNFEADDKKRLPGMADECFLRGKAPMTKEEIRVLSLSKLHLTKKSILYDIGAGTGSVSVEAALFCDEGRVYAIEQKKEAVELLFENKKRFHADAMEIVEGSAPECLEGLEAPTHAFIGGSSGQLSDIIRRLRGKNEKLRFVVNAVTMETVSAITNLTKEFPEYENMELIYVNVSRSRRLGGYHMMQAENPILIACFGGEGKAEESMAGLPAQEGDRVRSR